MILGGFTPSNSIPGLGGLYSNTPVIPKSTGTITPGTGGLNITPTVYTGPNAAPTYNVSDPYSLMALQNAGAMGAGWRRSGAAAFMPGDMNFADYDWSPVTSQYGDAGGPETSNTSVDDMNSWKGAFTQSLVNLANQLGYDTSKYDLTDTGKLGTNYADPSYKSYALRRKLGLDNRQAGSGNLQDLYDDMNKDLAGFTRMRQASAGWDGRGDPRSTATSLYYETSPGVYQPISPTQFGHQREHQGWAREEGAETLAGLSMIMPAFGGWAGILGNGVGGTLTAGGGLGLTSGLGAVGNMAANVIGNSLMSGRTPSLAGLFGGLVPGAASSLLNGGNLSNLFGNAAAVAGAPSYSSLGQLMNSGIGQAIRGTLPYRAIGPGANLGMRGINSLARLFS